MSALQKLKETAFLRVFTMLKIPLIAYLKPVVEELTDERCEIRLPLLRRSKNHLGAMYFGALCAGADCAGGLIAMRQIQKGSGRVVFVFKDFKADFKKRAEGDVVFACEDGAKLIKLVQQAEQSGERVEETVDVIATCPDKLGTEPVGVFQLTISLKARQR
jgi:acyl-coenzyme A thioesterase PaaI-like protein